MRKLLILLLSFCFVPLIVACGCNDPYGKRMMEYYTVDSNYENLKGIVTGIRLDCILEIYVLTDDNKFPVNINGCQEFRLYCGTISNYSIKEGDSLTFTSAPRIFYDGHILPLVSLEKNDEILLDFDIGKEELLKWIQEEF